jgi:hypothetical protein
MATPPSPAQGGADPVSPLMTEASAEIQADLPDAPAWALALRQMSMGLAKLQQGQEEVKTLQQGQAVEHAKTQQGLAALQLEVTELRVIQSNAHHISTLQCQLTVHAERDAAHAEQLATMNRQHADMHAAHVDQLATMNRQLAESEAVRGQLYAQNKANTDAQHAMEVRNALPVVAGAAFHEDCITWIEKLGLDVKDVHYTPHSADAIVAVPFGSTTLRMLVDFKYYKNLTGVNELAATVVRDAAGKGVDGVMLLYPDKIIPAQNSFASDPSWANRLMGSEKIGKGGADPGIRSDRQFVCDRTTFLKALFQLVVSHVQADAPLDQHRHDLFVRITSILGMLPATQMGDLLQLCASVTKGSQAANYDKVMHLQKAWVAAGAGALVAEAEPLREVSDVMVAEAEPLREVSDVMVAEAEPLREVSDVMADITAKLGDVRDAFLLYPGALQVAIDNCATMGGKQVDAEKFWRSAKCADSEVRAELGDGHAALHFLSAAIGNCATMGGERGYAENCADDEECPLNKSAKRPRGY